MDVQRLRFVVAGVAASLGFFAALLTVAMFFGVGIGILVSVGTATFAAGVFYGIWPRLAVATGLSSEGVPICDSGPYRVGPGETKKIRLDVSEGKAFGGHISELDGQDFNWYILDDMNAAKFFNKEWGLKTLRKKEGKISSYVYCRIPKLPSGGIRQAWYLLLDTYGKQNPRKIEVNLYRVGR